jgi:hypothetical protein
MGALDLYCVIACTVCVAGLGSKLVRLGAAARRTPALPRPENAMAGKAPGPTGTLAKSVAQPWRAFCARANPCWSAGCIAYHLAIAIVVCGYTLSLACLVVRLGQGRPFPHALLGQPTLGAYHPSNIAALVFGNSEPAASRFLFGRGHHFFVLATHAEVLLALFGNACLLVSLFRRRMGAVLHDLDTITSGLRRSGRFSVEHLVVRGLIFLIIQAELVARLHLWPQVVYLHVVLAMTFLVLLPFSYLTHVVYTPVALALGYRRRRDRITA